MSACPYCREGSVSEEIFGVRVHRFTDTWIACSAGNQEIFTKNEVILEGETLCASIQNALNSRMRVDEILNAQP